MIRVRTAHVDHKYEYTTSRCRIFYLLHPSLTSPLLTMAFLRFLACLPLVTAAATPQLLDSILGPEVELDYGTFKGHTRFAGVDSFLGIPFAKAPRLANPVLYTAADKFSGVQDATQYGPACPQQELTATQLAPGAEEISSLLSAVEQLAFAPLLNQAEDCLSINVQIPAGMNASEAASLPVMVWIFGGGFQLGSSAAFGSEGTALQGSTYQGAKIVQRSVQMGQPVVFVSANYRVNAFGTLASQELTDAGATNLMLKDQRMALRWVQKYIGLFGGDKERVTIFGESAGSVSVASQMLLNSGDTEGLFRAAIMASGGILKLKDYHAGQETFDFIAEKCGCGSASDKLACLRAADYNTMYNAVQQVPNFFSYTGLAVPWNPRPDGSFIPASPHVLLREGKIAKIPYIIGDMKDEGTLFSLVPQLRLQNDQEFQSFWQDNYFKNLTDAQVKAFTDKYPQEPAAGSPFDTGSANAIGPQYKRLAAAQGDYMFQSGRRDLLNYTYARQPAYTYLIEQSLPVLGQIAPLSGLTGLPLLGSFHASEVLFNAFGSIPAALSKNTLNIMSTFIAFVNTLNPNEHGLKGLPEWPTWDPSGKSMFRYKESGCDIIRDDYREEAMDLVNNNPDTYMS